jgi:phosphopantothenoylcysteine synthetase/decarboxylase
MNILLTSGGTRIPIDTVRHIGNMSNGTTGSLIAEEILRKTSFGLTFLTSKSGKTPFKVEADVWNKPNSDALLEIHSKYELAKNVKNRYKEIQYTTFDDYHEAIREECIVNKPDAIILSAAVSDYGCVPVNGKIRSKKDMTIELSPLPKIISQVKCWAPASILIGFKLLVGAEHGELIDSAMQSIEKNGCDLVVANDWNDITKGDRSIYLVSGSRPSDVHEVKFNKSDKYSHAKELISAIRELIIKREKQKEKDIFSEAMRGTK